MNAKLFASLAHLGLNVFILFIAHPVQAADCGNGLEQALTIGGRAWIIPEPPQAVNVRTNPNGNRTGQQLQPGEQFTVLDGPECANGISWWQVESDTGITGWIAEGTDDYFVEMLSALGGVGSAGQEIESQPAYEPERVTLFPSDPAQIVEGISQVSFIATGGGGSNCRDIIYVGSLGCVESRLTYTPGQTYEVTIYQPDGRLYRQETIHGSTADDPGFLSAGIPTLPGIPIGTWSIEFRSGSQFERRPYQLINVSEPTLWWPLKCTGYTPTLVMTGFEPDEVFDLAFIRGEQIEETLDYSDFQEIYRWRLRAGSHGELMTKLGFPAIRRTSSDVYVFVLTDETGSWHNVLDNLPRDMRSPKVLQYQEDDVCYTPNTVEEAKQQLLTTGDVVTGLVEESTSGWYAFEGSAGDTITIQLIANTTHWFDPFLRLLSPDGSIVAENDDSTDPDFGILDAEIEHFTLPSTGIYSIQVSGKADLANFFFSYTLLFDLDQG